MTQRRKPRRKALRLLPLKASLRAGPAVGKGAKPARKEPRERKERKAKKTKKPQRLRARPRQRLQRKRAKAMKTTPLIPLVRRSNYGKALVLSFARRCNNGHARSSQLPPTRPNEPKGRRRLPTA